MARRRTNTLLAQQLGARLRERRVALGLSQEAIAERADVHRTYVGRVEHGEVGITVDMLMSFSIALGASASELLDGLD